MMVIGHLIITSTFTVAKFLKAIACTSEFSATAEVVFLALKYCIHFVLVHVIV